MSDITAEQAEKIVDRVVKAISNTHADHDLLIKISTRLELMDKRLVDDRDSVKIEIAKLEGLYRAEHRRIDEEVKFRHKFIGACSAIAAISSIYILVFKILRL